MDTPLRKAKLKTQITNQVMSQVWTNTFPLLPNSSDEIRNQINSQFKDIEICNEILWEVGNRIYDQVKDQVGNQIRNNMNPLNYTI